MSETERWLAIAGFEGLYEVSDAGRVRGLDRYSTVPVFMGNAPQEMGRRLHRGRVLKPWPDLKGVLKVYLCPGGGRRLPRSVHILVLEAFVSPRPEGMDGLHGPNGRDDNSVVNLSWGSKQKNLGPDKRRDGTDNGGERHNMVKLTVGEVAEIRRRCAGGESQSSAGRAFGVSQSQVWRIVHGKRWATADVEALK